jgi:hypothetical protein
MDTRFKYDPAGLRAALSGEQPRALRIESASETFTFTPDVRAQNSAASAPSDTTTTTTTNGTSAPPDAATNDDAKSAAPDAQPSQGDDASMGTRATPVIADGSAAQLTTFTITVTKTAGDTDADDDEILARGVSLQSLDFDAEGVSVLGAPEQQSETGEATVRRGWKIEARRWRWI